MARELRRRKIPRDQISYFLGHIEPGEGETTEVYAPMLAEYCKDALQAIEDIILEIRANLKARGIDDPELEIQDPSQHLGIRHLTESQALHLKAILSAAREVDLNELGRRFGVTSQAIRKRAKRWGLPLKPKRAASVPQ